MANSAVQTPGAARSPHPISDASMATLTTVFLALFLKCLLRMIHATFFFVPWRLYNMRPMLACALLLAAVAVAACHTMKAVPMAQVNTIKPDRAWLTETDNTVILVNGPQMVGDTLVGYVNGKYEEMPIANFKQLVIQTGSTPKTVALVALVTAGFGGMIYALAGGKNVTNCDPSYCEEHSEDPCCG